MLSSFLQKNKNKSEEICFLIFIGGGSADEAELEVLHVISGCRVSTWWSTWWTGCSFDLYCLCTSCLIRKQNDKTLRYCCKDLNYKTSCEDVWLVIHWDTRDLLKPSLVSWFHLLKNTSVNQETSHTGFHSDS